MEGTYGRRPSVEAWRAARRYKETMSSPSDWDYTPDEVEFMFAVEAYKRKHQRPFPKWSEVLQVLKGLGYRKVEPVPLRKLKGP